MKRDTQDSTVVLGAGPAGLTAALELDRLNRKAVVLEQDDLVGGISRTVSYQGYRFDIGGHRFFTKVSLVQQIWQDLLGEDFLERPRLSRIHYKGRFFDYPLKPMNALIGLGVVESILILVSYLKARLLPNRDETNFEQWVTNRFGHRLYEIFFKTYTEKVWGVPCTEIGSEWAAQRIKNLDLVTAVKNAFLGARAHKGEVVASLIDRFHYPRHGPGMMWERVRDRLESRDIRTHMNSKVIGLIHENGLVQSAVVENAAGDQEEVLGSHFISSIPLRSLIRALTPSPPEQVLAAANSLRYRDFLTVVLIVDRPDVFPDNWIYIHAPEVRLGRVQNFKNWSPEMVPDAKMTSLGLEYFVQVGDDLWNTEDSALLALGEQELITLGLIEQGEVVDGTVVRMPKAYPVYDQDYKDALATIRPYLDSLNNLESIGRNGQHRYNNQDHSMLTGIWAARNVAGDDYDVWSVNVDQEYHEESTSLDDRLVPGPAVEDIDLLIAKTFARFDAVALGVSVGAIAAVLLLIATSVLLLKGGEPMGPNLSLLGHYFYGYEVTWPGALIGTLEAAVIGMVFGSLLGKALNWVIGFYEKSLLQELELASIMESLGPNR